MTVLCQANDGWEGPYNYAILVDISDPTHPVQMLPVKLPHNRWVAMGSGLLHGVAERWFPPDVQHNAFSVSGSTSATEIEDLGWLDVERNRVDNDGPYLSVSRNRLEVHQYGICPTMPGPVDPPAVAGVE
jgi:hypothetical protein